MEGANLYCLPQDGHNQKAAGLRMTLRLCLYVLGKTARFDLISKGTLHGRRRSAKKRHS